MSKKKNIVVLAYSGGLDTSVAIKWIKEKYGLDVIAVTVDAGQKEDFSGIQKRALETGALEAHIVDAKDEFAAEYLIPALKANALYERQYPLVSSLSRPLIAKHVIRIAEESGAGYVAHGCTGKGNDQVRLELAFAALNPGFKVIAPVRENKMSREEAMEYAGKHRIPVEAKKKSPYSIDENIWGRAIECGVLEDPWQEPPADVYKLTMDPEKLNDQPEYIELGFEKGVPVSLNGKKMKPMDLFEAVGKIAGEHGFGRIDMIENRFVGIKSREVYEAPAAMSLIKAHQDLEKLTLERDLSRFKEGLEAKYAELVYYGYWFSPLKDALDAFMEQTQQMVTGKVKLKYYRGGCYVAGRASEYSLYEYSLATYEKDKDEFVHDSAKGFIDILKMPILTWASKKKGKGIR